MKTHLRCLWQALVLLQDNLLAVLKRLLPFLAIGALRGGRALGELLRLLPFLLETLRVLASLLQCALGRLVVLGVRVLADEELGSLSALKRAKARDWKGLAIVPAPVLSDPAVSSI
jgi:hypothetical protein